MPVQSCGTGLLADYTFETFVEGKSNRRASLLAKTVSENPGYLSPLIIVGGQGIGKTHLMHATGHAALSNYPDTKILCLSAEMLSSSLIRSFRENTLREYQLSYRELDMLLVDDIQFLADKPRALEELISMTTYLVGRNKQVVMTSDLVMLENPGIGSLLSPGYGGGIGVRIEPSDDEICLRLLERSFRERGVSMSVDIAEYIVGMNTGNMREMIGLFLRIMSFSFIENTHVNIDLAKRAINNVQL